jgi:two-component system, NarL family, nitrate/nitrite response regulator NarL
VADQIRILLADDHPVVRRGLKFSVEEDPTFKVIAEAGDGEEALDLIKKLNPQLAILDIDMPRLDGLGVAKEVGRLNLDTKMIFLSFHKDEDVVRTVLSLGGKGYLLKDSAMQEIVVAMKTVLSGKNYVSSTIAIQLLAGEDSPAPSPESGLTRDLTASERRILMLIADGFSSKEIGNALSIHYRTVENHRTNICRKLKIEGANALLRFAVQNKGQLR